jgi:hypothetical protein
MELRAEGQTGEVKAAAEQMQAWRIDSEKAVHWRVFLHPESSSFSFI